MVFLCPHWQGWYSAYHKMCFLDSQHKGLRVGAWEEGKKGLTCSVFLVPVCPQVKSRHVTQRRGQLPFWPLGLEGQNVPYKDCQIDAWLHLTWPLLVKGSKRGSSERQVARLSMRSEILVKYTHKNSPSTVSRAFFHP